MIFDTIYLGKDNLMTWEMTQDDLPYSPSSSTRMTLKIGTKLIDSDTAPNVFDWTTIPNSVRLNMGFEQIPLGLFSDCVLTVYNAQNPNGVVWDCNISLEVRSC